MKTNAEEMQSFIENLAEFISEGQYALTNLGRAEIIAEYIQSNMDFDEAGAEGISPLPGYLVFYKEGKIMMPQLISESQRQLEILRNTLSLSSLIIDKMDEISAVSSGFSSFLFVRDEKGINRCASILNIEINNAAISTYSRFLKAYLNKECASLDEFIGSELNKQRKSEEYGFMLFSDAIGNELLFDVFKSSDIPKLEERLKEYKLSFSEVSRAFEKDYNLEFLRCVLCKIKKSGEEDNDKKLLTSQILHEILEELKPWLFVGLIETQASELFTNAKEYFFEGFEERFGSYIEVNKEVEEIKCFYSAIFGEMPENKLSFFKNYSYRKKYRNLKKKSFDLIIRSFNTDDKADGDIIDARKVLSEVEKANRQLEKESEELHSILFEDSKETLLNCMSVAVGNKSVLGREAGELARIFELVDVSQ